MPKTHPTYDEDFRRKAVDLLISNVRPLKEVSRNLGISANSLRQWRDRSFGVHVGSVKAASPTPSTPIGPAAENPPLAARGRALTPLARILSLKVNRFFAFDSDEVVPGGFAPA
jgi:transposase-like protein